MMRCLGKEPNAVVNRSVKEGPVRGNPNPPKIYYNPEQVVSVRVTNDTRGEYIFLAPIKCSMGNIMLECLLTEGEELEISITHGVTVEHLSTESSCHVVPNNLLIEKGEMVVIHVTVIREDKIRLTVDSYMLAFTLRTTHDAPDALLQRLSD